MTSQLPSNPSTISDTRRRANTWTPQSVEKKYAGLPMTAKLLADINGDLAELSTWDNYERCISQTREATKAALRRLIPEMF